MMVFQETDIIVLNDRLQNTGLDYQIPDRAFRQFNQQCFSIWVPTIYILLNPLFNKPSNEESQLSVCSTMNPLFR